MKKNRKLFNVAPYLNIVWAKDGFGGYAWRIEKENPTDSFDKKMIGEPFQEFGEAVSYCGRMLTVGTQEHNDWGFGDMSLAELNDIEQGRK